MKLEGKKMLLTLLAAAFILSGIFGSTVSEASYYHHDGGYGHHGGYHH